MNPYRLAALVLSVTAMPLYVQSAHSASDTKSCIIGNVSITPALANALGATPTLFVYAREVDRASGPPTVVVSIKKPRYPQAFKLCPNDQMVPGTTAKPLSGLYRVYARHSLTGAPMVEEGLVGAVAGESGAGVKAGASVEILINRAIDKSK